MLDVPAVAAVRWCGMVDIAFSRCWFSGCGGVQIRVGVGSACNVFTTDPRQSPRDQ